MGPYIWELIFGRAYIQDFTACIENGIYIMACIRNNIVLIQTVLRIATIYFIFVFHSAKTV